MPRKGENIYKRKDGRWEGRYIRSYDSEHKAKYAYVYGKTYSEVKRKLTEQRGNVQKVQPTKNKSSTYMVALLLAVSIPSRITSLRLSTMWLTAIVNLYP